MHTTIRKFMSRARLPELGRTSSEVSFFDWSPRQSRLGARLKPNKATLAS